MGRLGPLTSRALGRSPYDAVFQGEGDSDPRAPPQMYDERGRPVNQETKRINKEVVRSHNEVMHVIGVVEPENGGVVDSQADARLKQQINGDKIGQRLWDVGISFHLYGFWALNGLRQRLLIYRSYAQTPFLGLYALERSRRSVGGFFLEGLPTTVVSEALQHVVMARESLRDKTWIKIALPFVRLHLELFVVLQRTGLVSSSYWLPGLAFFIPFSSEQSLIPPPAPLSELSPRGVLQWLGGAAFNAIPFASWTALRYVQAVFTKYVAERIYWNLIPTPATRRTRRASPPRPPPSPPPESLPTQTERPSLPAVVQHQQAAEAVEGLGRTISHDEATMRALEGRIPPPPLPENQPPVGAVRRRSTVSSRGDEYVSDDEETEIVSATLISFDVEATESTDTPPGVWSAELRPNVTGDSRVMPKEDPVYAENLLTTLPAVLAAELFAGAAVTLLLVPVEAFGLRLFARTFRALRGLPVFDMHGLNPLSGLSWTAVGNLLGVTMMGVLVASEGWSVTIGLAELYRGADADWDFSRVVREKLAEEEDD